MACAVRSTASVRCLCVGLFLQFCLHLGEAQCDTYHIQCRDVVQALGGIIQCPRILWGGANMVALCNGTSGTRKAVRMSLLANTDKQDQYFIRLGDMLSNAATGPSVAAFESISPRRIKYWFHRSKNFWHCSRRPVRKACKIGG